MFAAWLPDFHLPLRCAADYPHLPEPEENGATFEANAIIKAEAWSAATGLPALADDSGLVVDALGGAPGIYSARYAETPAARIERVLAELREATDSAQRTARFMCAVALAVPGRPTLTREGRVEGWIGFAPRGEGGFGYDPIFELTEPPHIGRTMAELSADEKHALSHRGRALQALLPELRRML